MKFVQFFLKPKNPNFATTLREMIRKYVWFESKKRMPLRALKKKVLNYEVQSLFIEARRL